MRENSNDLQLVTKMASNILMAKTIDFFLFVPMRWRYDRKHPRVAFLLLNICIDKFNCMLFYRIFILRDK